MRIPVILLSFVLLSTTLISQAQTAPAEASKQESAPARTDAVKNKTPPGGVEILSDTQGVDFKPWVKRWHQVTENTWNPLIPDEVKPPKLAKGMVAIRFKVRPDGRLMDGSMVLEGRSGDTSLDRAAWGAITGSSYPPLPADFKGPFLELRAYFLYNMEPRHEGGSG